MIKTITLVFVAATLSLAQTGPKTAQPAAQQPQARVLPVSIPPEATEAGPNLYRYTDKSGKTWLYSRTPFGISKREEKPAPQSAAFDPQLVTVTDLGDSVRFERKVPFGIRTWVSRKSELTDGEESMLLRDQLKNQSESREVAPASAERKQ